MSCSFLQYSGTENKVQASAGGIFCAILFFILVHTLVSCYSSKIKNNHGSVTTENMILTDKDFVEVNTTLQKNNFILENKKYIEEFNKTLKEDRKGLIYSICEKIHTKGFYTFCVIQNFLKKIKFVNFVIF